MDEEIKTTKVDVHDAILTSNITLLSLMSCVHKPNNRYKDKDIGY